MGAGDVHPATNTTRNDHDGVESIRQQRQGKGRRRRLLAIGTKKRSIPWGSVVALLITWIGLYLFAFKLYDGMLDLETHSAGVFKFLIPYLQMVRQATVITAITMAAITALMAIVGFCATLHCEHAYRGDAPSCVCGRLGSRVMCAIFWILSYLLNIGWMFILSFMVVMTSAYFAFLPVCLPQSGTVDAYCLNFTVLSNMISGSNDVNLLLCGGAIDKLCKLTKAILPWYWGAYLGCMIVILGLSHFNGSLAANFAHGKHAVRYVKIRDRTSSAIEWTKDWRVKSLVYYDIATDSALPLRKKSLKMADPTSTPTTYYSSNGTAAYTHANGYVQNGFGPPRRGPSASASCSDATETAFELEEPDSERLSSKNSNLKASNTSIVLSLQKNGDVKKVLALPPAPSATTVVWSNDMRPAPPYRPRPLSSQSEHSSQGPPSVPPKPRFSPLPRRDAKTEARV